MKKIFQKAVVAVLVFMGFILSSSIAVFASVSANGKQAISSQSNTALVPYMGVNSNVNTIHATTVGAMPCVGEAKILVFYTDFLNGASNWSKTKEEVENMFFSEEGKTDASLAYSDSDSLRSFYYRSSYGKVDITGRVFEYQTQKDTSYYTSTSTVLDEIIDYYEDIINWDDYDANEDGYIDGIYLIARNKHSWTGPNFVGNYANEVGGKKICKACFLDSEDLLTACHETCHMFGPADMYANVSLNPGGIATESIMDGGRGDLPSATKFILGWLDNVKFVDLTNTGTFDLRSYSNYSDVLVVYPNGNSDNRNWFFIEYVTREGNNLTYGLNYGLRVWKSQMHLDEDYNIVGSKNYSSGMPRSPYNFLEAIHPYNEGDYYLNPGDSVTPYSVPSTSYSDTFYSIGGAKFLKDLTFSGINISFDSLNSDVAKVTVTIEENPREDYSASGRLTTFNAENTSSFLDEVSKVHFATISCDIEVKLPTEVKIKAVGSGNEYNVEFALSKNSREILLYLDSETLLELKNQGEFEFCNFSLNTYLGTPVVFEAEDQTLTLENYPTPLKVETTNYSTGFNMSFAYNMTAFKLSESKVLTIYSDDIAKKLYWASLDLTNNTVQKSELEIPFEVNQATAWPNNDGINIWQDGSLYYVFINNYLCCYQDAKLVSSLQLSGLKFAGSDGNSFFVSSSTRTIYHARFNGESIQLDAINLKCTLTYGLITNIYNLVEKQYIVTTKKNILFVDLNANTVKQIDFTVPEGLSQYAISISYLNGYYYIFSSFEDIVMYQYDQSFNLIYQKCLLKDISKTTWGPFELNVCFDGNQWVMSFSSVSNANTVSYLSTYLATFSLDGTINSYWRYGDSTFRYECTIIPLNSGRFLGLEASKFFYINSHHTPSDWITEIAPTCTTEGVKYKECSICGLKLETAIIPMHTPQDGWSIVREATCTENGLKHKVCTVCNAEVETQVINAYGHTESAWIVDKAATCSEGGSMHKECIVCRNIVATEKLGRLEHSYLQYSAQAETCTVHGWNAYEICTRCGITTYTEIPAKGHTYGEWTQTIAPGRETKGEERRDCVDCNHYETREVDAIDYLQDFIDAVDNLSPNALAEVAYSEIYSALQIYAKLTEEEKEEVSASFAILQQAIADYNEKAEIANKELADATKIAFVPIVTSFVFLAALLALLKKKFMI